MSNRKGYAAMAACAALACAGLVRADDSASFQQNGLALQPVYMADAAPRRPLMMGAEKAGASKQMDEAGINVFGHVEASWTYSASSPPANVITGRVFDFENQDLTLNQIDLTLQRAVDASKGKFDVGATLEMIYGGDARLIHANGAEIYGPKRLSPNLHPDEQLDFTQAYVDFAVPVGNGLLVRAGKMVTHMGYEYINPTLNPLFSHSYSFGFAIPFTHTGVMAFYNINDKLSVMGGMSRGWNQYVEDNNGDAIDGLGQVVYKMTDKTTLTFNATIGPEGAGDPGNWWWVGEGILSQKIGDQLTVGVDAVYGLYIHSGQWYGLTGYGAYTLNDMFTLNARAEWYDDQDGFTLTGTPNVVYEVTFGVGIKPMPNNDIGKNLLIRPEVRFDYSDHAFFDAGTDHYQWTAGVDAIFMF